MPFYLNARKIKKLLECKSIRLIILLLLCSVRIDQAWAITSICVSKKSIYTCQIECNNSTDSYDNSIELILIKSPVETACLLSAILYGCCGYRITAGQLYGVMTSCCININLTSADGGLGACMLAKAAYHAIQESPKCNKDKKIKSKHPVVNLWIL